MILTRLFVREKLNILVIIPLVVVLVTTVPFVADRLSIAHSSTRLGAETEAATEVARLVKELQRERLLSLAFLAAPRDPDRGPLVRQAQTVSDTVAEVRAALADQPQLGVTAVLPAVGELGSTRRRVLSGKVDGIEVYDAFGSIISQLTDSLRRHGGGLQGASEADRVSAFRALATANEEADSAGAALMAALATTEERSRATVAARYASARALEQAHVAEFRELATPAQIRLFNLTRQGAAAPTISGVEPLTRPGASLPGSAAEHARLVTQLSGAIQAQSTVRLLVQDKVARDLEDELAASAREGRLAASVIGGLALATIALVVALSVVVGRSIARPLRRLSVSAGEVADLAHAELIRVSDEDMADNSAPPQLAAIDVRSSDEIGELATAFNRVQATAALLLERQVVTRRNVATMFANIGRRTQNLVGRQLALIDQLERDERDPAVLENLYRLDHLSTRLQRSANSLVVLSGRAEEGSLSQPMPLANAIRAGLGEIEGFRQVQLIEIDRVLITPSSALDIVLMLAELLENATSFSPPHVPVEVTARVRENHCTVLIIDHGIGMSDEQLAEENRRLVERERLDLAPTDVLGLFVVGRLARRHRLTVELRPTPGGGVTVEVTIPGEHLIRLAPASPTEEPELARGGPTRRGRPPANSALTAIASRPAAQLAAQPPAQPPAQQVTASAPGGGFGWWQSHQPANGSPATSTPPTTANGLRRRIRGARLPDAGPLPAPPVPAGPQSADAARAMVEEFEAAVRQASAEPVPPPSAPEHPEPGHPAPPPGATGLRRRVRGAQLPSTGTVMSNARGPARATNADAARAMVDEFESGVTRATGSTGDPEGGNQ